jgi:hypothetical protein
VTRVALVAEPIAVALRVLDGRLEAGPALRREVDAVTVRADEEVWVTQDLGR